MKHKIKQILSNLQLSHFIVLTVAGIINSLGVTIFLSPVQLYDSGISGTSMLLSQITPDWLSLSVFLIVLNTPLFIYGYKKQGSVFTVYSIYTILIYSLGAWLITDVLPVDVSIASPLAGNDLLLCALFGGVISGIGSGLTIRFGGAIDGIEVMAVIFAKKLGLSVGSFVMIYNVILYVVCGFVIDSWILPLYSIVTYFAALKTVDFVVEGIDRSKSVTIITDRSDEICENIMAEFEQGVTKISAEGGYSKSQKTVIYFVVNRFQIAKLKDIVISIDKNAYISISDVAEVCRCSQDV